MLSIYERIGDWIMGVSGLSGLIYGMKGVQGLL